MENSSRPPASRSTRTAIFTSPIPTIIPFRNSIKRENFMARWGGEPSAQEGCFYYPRGLAAGPEGDVYIADSGNNRVQQV